MGNTYDPEISAEALRRYFEQKIRLFSGSIAHVHHSEGHPHTGQVTYNSAFIMPGGCDEAYQWLTELRKMFGKSVEFLSRDWFAAHQGDSASLKIQVCHLDEAVELVRQHDKDSFMPHMQDAQAEALMKAKDHNPPPVNRCFPTPQIKPESTQKMTKGKFPPDFSDN
ncbi:MAG: hypothetical protein JO089_04305 [Alphaproteobacteria bacterium]|nr:hypothetical protein [Alphaproteobacteria bacterium]